MTADPPVLWHLKVSPYNEKGRWALDYKRIPHVRKAAAPGRHTKIARRLCGGSTFPVLQLGGDAIGDSTDIIAALERRWPEPPLYPSHPDERRRALELEDFFDEEVGPYERRLLLHHVLPEQELLFGMFAPDLGRARRLLARAGYSRIRRGIETTFEIDAASIELAFAKLRAAGERFRSSLQPSGYLVGDRFTVADLTAAAIVSPVVAPPEFGYPQPQRGHPRTADIRDLLDDYGWCEWVRDIYARHRGESAQIDVSA